MFKKLLVHTRRGIKISVLFGIAVFLIIGAVAFLYKPTYSVFINYNIKLMNMLKRGMEVIPI